MASYRGVYAWLHGDACVVSTPANLVRRMAVALRGRGVAQMLDASLFTSILGDDIERFVGPAAIAYADATDFVPSDERSARLLGAADDGALRALAEASGETAWEHSGIEFGRVPVFGCLAGAELVAAASYEVLGGTIAHVGFVTHPAHRGRGLGRAVASAATAHGLAAGLIAQWQTLESNAPSMAVQRELGFQPYCRTLAIRLN